MDFISVNVSDFVDTIWLALGDGEGHCRSDEKSKRDEGDGTSTIVFR